MRIDEHPYLFLYLAGCVLSLILIVLGNLVAGVVGWITRANIVNKNLKKLLPPQTFAVKASLLLGTIAFSVALSWINVLLVLLWQIPVSLFGILRELFSSTPETIKLLRFPLKNNPYLSREAVWAYVQALQIKLGQIQPGESALRASLDEVFGYYPTFDRAKALNKLKALSGDVPPSFTAGSALAATVTEGDEPYLVDEEGWEYANSHIELYPSQREFVYKAWWMDGTREEEYTYRVDPDCHLMCQLRNAKQTGTRSGEGKFEDRFYDLHTVRDGVVIEDAVRLVFEDNSITSPSHESSELSTQTEWHEITSASRWPELWYNVIKIHVGEDEARRGIRKELERLKRGLRIVTEETSQRFTLEHDEEYKFSTFKPIDESTLESNRAILADALERSGLTMSEARAARFRIRSLATLLGDAKGGIPNKDSVKV
jgi:hypothetical protein